MCTKNCDCNNCGKKETCIYCHHFPGGCDCSTTGVQGCQHRVPMPGERKLVPNKGDMIRSMDNDKLADLFTSLTTVLRSEIIKKLQDAGVQVEVSIIELPAIKRAAHKAWLDEPAEGVL